MYAESKDELLAVTEKEFLKLSTLLDQVGSKAATRKREENTSLKDVIGHRAHWIKLFFGWYKDGRAGREVFFPAKGYKWNQLKEFNQNLRVEQSDLSWTDARKLLLSRHKKLLGFIKRHSNDELYGDSMKGAKNDWTVGRWVESVGPSHYRSAHKYARQCLRESKDRG